MDAPRAIGVEQGALRLGLDDQVVALARQRQIVERVDLRGGIGDGGGTRGHGGAQSFSGRPRRDDTPYQTASATVAGSCEASTTTKRFGSPRASVRKAPEVLAARDLAVDPDHPVARRIAGGAHIDLLHLRRPWDEKGKRFKQDLPVDEIRRTVGFFGSTAGEGGWRIAIVDAADDLNTNAANALLKVLEEPPPRSLFLVVAHAPGRLLPTIRSRCRRLELDRLPPHRIAEALSDFGIDGDPATFAAAAELADGSLRRAALLVKNDGVRLRRSLEKIVAGLPELDVRAAHAFADLVAQRGADDAFEIAVDFLLDLVGMRAREALAGLGNGAAARFAEAHDEIGRIIARTEALNLDRKAAILAAIRTLAEAARN